MRALFVETVKDKRSSKNYKNNRIQTKQPKINEALFYAKQKSVPAASPEFQSIQIPIVVSSDINNEEFTKEEINEITSFAKLYLIQLEKQLEQMKLLERKNPLMQYEFLKSSLELYESSIKTIQKYIEDKNVKELQKYLDKTPTNEVI